jgi:molecular chaperone DnaK
VAALENAEPMVVPNAGGYKTMPSVFAIREDGRYLVGHSAKHQRITNPEHTAFATKRLIGRRFDSSEVQRSLKDCVYPIISGPNEDPRVELRGRAFTCPEIAGVLLRELKQSAESCLGEEVDSAVITVPAYFNDTQRQCTRDAGRIAGLDVLRIINEPTAAALAYGMGRAGEERIAIYDLGGGTFDMSILEMSDGVVEVLATAGDTFLGGEDFDRRIVDYLADLFEANEGVDLRKGVESLQRLKDVAERVKCELSQCESSEINLPFIHTTPDGPLHLNHVLSRPTLEDLVGDIVERTLKSVERCLADANLKPDEIDQIVVVGGQSRMPLVQAAVTDFFGKRPHKGVNPDEVVAVGAALQASSLVEEYRDVLLLDVTPLSLGVSTRGGHFSRLIDRNTTVPVSKAHIFTTTHDEQSAVRIRVLQGENDLASDNDLLGEFVLAGIPKAPKGEPEIEVSFDIDSSGIVSVSARDLETGREQSITVNSRGTLSEAEMQRIMAESEAWEMQLKA